MPAHVPAFSYSDFSTDFDVEITTTISKDKFFTVKVYPTPIKDTLFTVFAGTYSYQEDQILRFKPQLTTQKDQFFTVGVNFIERTKDQFFKVKVGQILTEGTLRDPILNILILLKNNWSLTDEGLTVNDILFSTGWYDNDNMIFPQITITPAYNRKQILSCGSRPLYRYEDTINLNIWVRPKSDSNTSYGWAKNAEYKIRQEVKRIIQYGSHIQNYLNIQDFAYLGRWRQLDEITSGRPVLLRSQMELKYNYFREEYEEA